MVNECLDISWIIMIYPEFMRALNQVGNLAHHMLRDLLLGISPTSAQRPIPCKNFKTCCH